jgi:hypothetical protein
MKCLVKSKFIALLLSILVVLPTSMWSWAETENYIRCSLVIVIGRSCGFIGLSWDFTSLFPSSFFLKYIHLVIPCFPHLVGFLQHGTCSCCVLSHILAKFRYSNPFASLYWFQRCPRTLLNWRTCQNGKMCWVAPGYWQMLIYASNYVLGKASCELPVIHWHQFNANIVAEVNLM